MNLQSYANPALVDFSRSWQQLTTYQHDLDLASQISHLTVPFEALPHEDSTHIRVTIDNLFDRIVLRLQADRTPADRLRVWATPDLVLVRARLSTTEVAERLIRLTSSIDPDSAEFERTGDVLQISLQKRAALPVALWPTSK